MRFYSPEGPLRLLFVIPNIDPIPPTQNTATPLCLVHLRLLADNPDQIPPISSGGPLIFLPISQTKWIGGDYCSEIYHVLEV